VAASQPKKQKKGDWVGYAHPRKKENAVLITFKGAESPGSGRVGAIGALVFFHLRPLGRVATERFSAQLLRAHWSGPES